MRLERCINNAGLDDFLREHDWTPDTSKADFENQYYFKLLNDESEIKAVFVLINNGSNFYECHYAVAKDVNRVDLTILVWSIFNHFEDARFYGFTPKNNKAACHMAYQLGFRRASENNEFVLYVR